VHDVVSYSKLVPYIAKYNLVMIRRNSLYLILALTLISVPVFQAAHALTHVIDINTISSVQVDSNQDKNDTDTDIDKICLDCLALTAFGAIFSILAFFFHSMVMRQFLSYLKLRYTLRNFSSPYLSRAPPLA